MEKEQRDQVLDEVFRAITAVLYRHEIKSPTREFLAQLATDHMQEAMSK